jgi:hypothetical protein
MKQYQAAENQLKRILWMCPILAVTMLSGCVSSSAPATAEVGNIAWEGLIDGQTVFGIVPLSVQAGGRNPTHLRFYLDSPGENNSIGTAALTDSAVFAGDWYTQDTVNGSHTVYAVADYESGETARIAIAVNVLNRLREDTVPSSAIKMTPGNDPAPPQLAPAFRNVYRDPAPLDGPINTAGGEDSAFITPDSNTLYFWFNGDQMKNEHEQAQEPLTGIYRSQKTAGNWQEPQRLYLQYFNRIAFDGAETVLGSTLWFASAREGNYRGMDIWTAELVDGRWTRWTNAGQRLNQEYDLGELHVTADGSTIYYGSARAGGYGQSDIWLTRKVNGEWTPPENVATVNSSASEGQPCISEDSTEMWFTRATPGPEIFRSVNIGGIWQTPELVVSSLAGEPTLDAAGNLYFTHLRWDGSLNRPSEADIYVCYKK